LIKLDDKKGALYIYAKILNWLQRYAIACWQRWKSSLGAFDQGDQTARVKHGNWPRKGKSARVQKVTCFKEESKIRSKHGRILHPTIVKFARFKS